MKRYINLLPPEEQQEIKLGRINNQIQNFGSWLILSILVLVAFLAIAKVFLKSELGLVEQQVGEATSKLSDQQRSEIRGEVEALNRDLANARILQSVDPSWATILRELASIFPDDLTLESLSLTHAENKAEVTGRAGSRNSVLQFRKNLLASERFQNVNFPLINLEKAVDSQWKYRFYLKPNK